MYSEDMDLCVKITKLSWKIYYIPDASIVHHAGGSSSSRKESNFTSIMLRESVTRFMELHRGELYARFYRASMGLVAAGRILLLILALPLVIYSRGRQFIPRAHEALARTDRPIERRAGDPQHLLDLVQQLQRRPAHPVEL